ncbi:MAG: Transcription-repair-coupling factor [Bacteroidetes bacterium ADurb.Bin302]|nr:MAG: Transcription-repair-coupling factor [Bacteroidetes bacterium ADurb.Bin302]HPG54953.1 transcription-repair coupling factor [Candidatus Enterocola sp.]
MDSSDFLKILRQHPNFDTLQKWVSSSSKNLKINGFCGSSASIFLHEAQIGHHLPAVYVLHDHEEAGYFYNDLIQFYGDENIFYFPSSYKKKVKDGILKDSANQVLRTETLNAISMRSDWTIVTYPEALSEKVIEPNKLEKETLHLRVGEKPGIEFVIEALTEYGFEQIDFVYEPGQFSVRGSIIDVFSYSNDLPYRIDFFGDEVDSIRNFDIESQLSEDSQNEVSIISNTINTETKNLVPIFDFFPIETLFGLYDADYLSEVLQTIIEENTDNECFITAIEFEIRIKTYKIIEWGLRNHFGSRKTIQFNESIQPIFHKNFDLTASDFKQRQSEGFEVYVLSDNSKQIERLKDIFEDREEHIIFIPVLSILHEGFIDNDLKICVYTDHQIFERFQKYTLKSAKTRTGKVVLSLKELMQFQIGDYIVHTDHGVGKFGGLIRTEMGGKMQEVIKLTFKDDDIIFVNIHSLHRISKYKSKDSEPPKLNKLGTAAWTNLKEKTKKKVKDIARELIRLYAERREEKGFSYSPDSYLQQELEASFIYEDTPDQSKATAVVKKDMESEKPMDRLICGDVGFGKTEIAIRAAFKAVSDNKQVAVLVPTTVLAFQHYKSFSRRLKRFPCNIDYLSRARKPVETKKILEKTAAGRVDILIGTHKILGKEVKFKDLGLLIIDEEQKFGVSAKEKLRQLRTNIDTLTLSATPIPRTLQFSLMGARDLSVINTPPPNRYPIQTELIPFDDDVIKDAIEYEISRGGQVFFVNNRISNLPELEIHLRKLVPKARICVGHGQMDSEKLEEILINFINGEYDILLATSIIESGVDIPNVNTMFINSAQHFGLSDLHQLRGRVGRTNKKAFCYLITPPLSSLPTDSRRRLQAIENFSDLGSGIHIAMQDLDIRGAGNILGGEQSGFISDLGYETYHKILDESIHELKHDEFADVFAEEIKEKDNIYATDCVFESDLELLFPSYYVQNISERMDLYRRLDAIKEANALISFEKEMVDRFGEIPEVSQELIQVIRLRWLCMSLGIEKITLKNNRLSAYFTNNFQSHYYQSEIFNKILQYAMVHHSNTKFKEQTDKRLISIDGVNGIRQAYKCLEEMCL